MAPAQAEKARITNLSDDHIGFSRPTSIFLRPRNYRHKHLRWAKVDANQVDEKMKQLEAEGKIRIDFLDADGNIVADFLDDDEKEVVEINEEGDVVKVEPVETVETPKDEAKVALVEPPEKEHIPTVGSDEDGRPQMQNLQQDGPPSESAEDIEEGGEPQPEKEPDPEVPDEGGEKKPEEGETEGAEAPAHKEYTRKALKRMSLRKIREVLEEREIEIDSSHKDVLIEAILDRQMMAEG